MGKKGRISYHATFLCFSTKNTHYLAIFTFEPTGLGDIPAVKKEKQ